MNSFQYKTNWHFIIGLVYPVYLAIEAIIDQKFLKSLGAILLCVFIIFIQNMYYKALVTSSHIIIKNFGFKEIEFPLDKIIKIEKVKTRYFTFPFQKTALKIHYGKYDSYLFYLKKEDAFLKLLQEKTNLSIEDTFSAST